MSTWIFGYGSLIWRPDIEFVEARPGTIRGWALRLWQGSPDHRGTPERPGRVATLVPDPDGEVTGRAFRLPPRKEAAILARLDHREQGGYDRNRVQVRSLNGGAPFAEAWVYRATPNNPHWLGPASPTAIARHVATSSGPSGTNLEYVIRLEAALRELGAPNPHLLGVVEALDDDP